MHCGMATVLLLHAVYMHACVYAVPSADASQLQLRRRPAWEATTEAVIVCADPESPNPSECTFTAPTDGSYSFIWAEQPSDGGFDLIKLGLDPVSAVYVGDRFGRFFTDCCDGGPCEFLDTNLVRYDGRACTEAPSAPIPGPPPPPPPPDNPPCEPDPGVPSVTCCSLEPTGACQRPCCCDSGGSDFVEGYCRGTLNSTSSRTNQLASSSHNGALNNTPTTLVRREAAPSATAGNYSGLVVRAQLLAGQSLLMITSDGGLMSKRVINESANGKQSQLSVPTQAPPSAFRATQDMAIVCADPEGPGNPSECRFTAPATGRYSFVWATTASFDVVKLGAEPISAAYIGDRFGVYFTSCCGSPRGAGRGGGWGGWRSPGIGADGASVQALPSFRTRLV